MLKAKKVQLNWEDTFTTLDGLNIDFIDMTPRERPIVAVALIDDMLNAGVVGRLEVEFLETRISPVAQLELVKAI